MGGGEGEVPSSSDGLPNVGNGVADILDQFHSLSVLGVSGIVAANADDQLSVCIIISCWSKHLQIEPKQKEQL